MGGEVEMPMRDHEKAAANANFKVEKRKLIDICDAYKRRKYIEDLDILVNELGGVDGLLDALQVEDYNKGISADSLDVRERVFGTNHKEPPGRTGFCNMVLAALDDFMLKLLIVCAIFSIIVEIGFNINDPAKLATAWIEGFAILVAVAVVSLVSAWSDYKKEGQFLEQQKLEELSKNVSSIFKMRFIFNLFEFKANFLNVYRLYACVMETKLLSTETTLKSVISSKFKVE